MHYNVLMKETQSFLLTACSNSTNTCSTLPSLFTAELFIYSRDGAEPVLSPKIKSLKNKSV